MNKYKVSFIDGHDLKYKEFFTEAENKTQAIENTFQRYGANFDHAIIDVIDKGESE